MPIVDVAPRFRVSGRAQRSGPDGRFRGAHSSRVLVSASRRNELFPTFPEAKALPGKTTM